MFDFGFLTEKTDIDPIDTIETSPPSPLPPFQERWNTPTDRKEVPVDTGTGATDDRQDRLGRNGRGDAHLLSLVLARLRLFPNDRCKDTRDINT